MSCAHQAEIVRNISPSHALPHKIRDRELMQPSKLVAIYLNQVQHTLGVEEARQPIGFGGTKPNPVVNEGTPQYQVSYPATNRFQRWVC